MVDLARTRDCIILAKGDAYPVAVDPSLAASGWQGGIGVMWASSARDEATVKASDGYYAGFMLWGSNEDSDVLTGMSGSQPHYRIATVGAGGWAIQTSTYEKYTWASRQAGPLVPLTYQASDRLVFSLRGYLTKEDEWSLSGDPRAPNQYYIAFVTQAPSALNSWFLGVQVSI
jgi:hypothetical protein